MNQKRRTPELYERLGLQGKDQEGSPSKMVTMKTADNSEDIKLIVGNQKPAKGNPRLSDIYVRKPDDPQTWLVTPAICRSKRCRANGWIKK